MQIDKETESVSIFHVGREKPRGGTGLVEPRFTQYIASANNYFFSARLAYKYTASLMPSQTQTLFFSFITTRSLGTAYSALGT